MGIYSKLLIEIIFVEEYMIRTVDENPFLIVEVYKVFSFSILQAKLNV